MSGSNLNGVANRRLRPFPWDGATLARRLREDAAAARGAAVHVAGDSFDDEIHVGVRDGGVLRTSRSFRRPGGAEAVAASLFNLTLHRGDGPPLKLRSRYRRAGSNVFAVDKDAGLQYQVSRRRDDRREAFGAFENAVRQATVEDSRRPLVFVWCDHGYAVRESYVESLASSFAALRRRRPPAKVLIDVKPPGRGDYCCYRYADVLKGTKAEIDHVDRMPLDDEERFSYVVTDGAAGLRTYGVRAARYVGCVEAPAPLVREVDPTGCGDAVTALAALQMAAVLALGPEHSVLAREDEERAGLMAAAGAYVATKPGNEVLGGGLLDWLRGPPEAVVLVNGCFDGLHPGHQQLLRLAAGAGGAFQTTKVLVGVNDDSYIRQVKQAEPLADQGIRANTVSRFLVGLKVRHEVHKIGWDPSDLIRQTRPHALVKTVPDVLSEAEQAAVRDCKVSVLLVDRLPGHSSTDLRKAKAQQA